MTTTQNYTPAAAAVQFTRRSATGGLELYERIGGIEYVTPIQTTARKEKVEGRERLHIGFETTGKRTRLSPVTPEEQRATASIEPVWR